jgi:rhamnose utilization protein RhaD (predicted bifunctional aldolase and dehydrogenase)
MTQLEPLVRISQYYGKDPAFVIAGGGNTSYKTEDKLFIKASGISLANIDKNGFVAMSRKHLGEMEDKVYPEDAVTREEEVKQDLKKAIISPEHLRPSVETSLHNLISYDFVVHTHPTEVNALMCANHAAQEVEKRFGSRALYVEYTDPGYILFKKLQSRVKDYEEKYRESPRIIFLQNHGVFVGGDTEQEVKSTYDLIETSIRDQKEMMLPPGEIEEISSETSDHIAAYFKKKDLLAKAFKTPLSDLFSENREQYRKISKPFTPDIIVYCKSRYLFLEKGIGKDLIVSRIEEFKKNNGYYPRIIVQEQTGLILVEENEKSVQTVLEVFHDMMKISYLSEQFGGPHFMTPEQIAFIDNWEVENYRRSVSKSL